jgi:formate hydrogenlyase transcriptional activator
MTRQAFSDDYERLTPPHGIIGTSRSLTSVMQQIGMVAPTLATVLIQGETGTGKELIAQAIHDMSPRCDGPLVKLNCAAIPSGLIESELFGHERGAFTGALTRRIGCFENANGGTLFLDEIGDIAPDLQAKLLRVLQEQEFRRLGAMRSTRVDVRLVAATNRDLFLMMTNREFREDLYYRLSVFPITLPPLRHRPEDIPVLARHFIALYSARMNKIIDDIDLQTMDAMVAYHWPGNVRQLQNFIEHGVIVTQGSIFRPALSQLQSPSNVIPRRPKTLDDATRDHILQTLQETKWVVGGRQGAAARLGLARTTLIAKMRRLGIESPPGEMLERGSNRPQAFSATA